jgi:DNA-binding CsgD family transcriptional regulator
MSPHAFLVGPQSKCVAAHDNAAVTPRHCDGEESAANLQDLESSMLADAVNGLAAAIFFIDASRRVIHANTSGHAMLAQGHPVRMSGTRLSAKDAVAELLLRDELGIACSGDGAAAGRIAIPLSGEANPGEGPQRYVAHVLPLSSGAGRQAGRPYRAVAAVFVQKVAVCETVPFEAIARCFKLTPAEMRVLFAVVEVGGVPEVAPTLGISETTVKTHLQRVFDKTGTKRQADLVKFVAGFMSPLAEPLPQ